MKQYEWQKKDGFDWLLVCSVKEAASLLNRSSDLPDASRYIYGEDCFFLVNEERRIASCIPGLAYAFEYENTPPFGREAEVSLELSRLKLIDFEQIQLPGSIRMLGPVVGELCGIRYKFAACRKTEDLMHLIDDAAVCGDETILYTAAAQGLAKALPESETSRQIATIRSSLRYFGDLFLHSGFEGSMHRWMITYNARAIAEDCPSALLQAMPAGWFASSLDEAMRYSDLCVMASCTSAQTRQAARILSGVLFLLRTSRRSLQAREFASRLIDIPETRSEALQLSDGSMDICAKSLWCVLSAGSFVDAMQKAISLHAQSDQLCAISGGLAEALYSIPYYLKRKTVSRMDPYLIRSLCASMDSSLSSALFA